MIHTYPEMEGRPAMPRRFLVSAHIALPNGETSIISADFDTDKGKTSAMLAEFKTEISRRLGIPRSNVTPIAVSELEG